jgi:hypothetical protein
LEEGVIKYKGKVWVGHDASMQLKILQSLHSSPVGGHSGFSVTYKRIKELFAWPDMKKMIKQFVAQCTIGSKQNQKELSILDSYNHCMSLSMLGKCLA